MRPISIWAYKRQNYKGILLLGLAYTPDGVKIDEQDHSSQHLSYSIPTLQLQNSKLIKEINWKDGSNNEKLLTVKEGIHHQKADCQTMLKDKIVDMD
jgi:hypothetical protein